MTIQDSSTASFHGGSPGQDLTDIVDSLTENDLCVVLGNEVVSLIRALTQSDNTTERLRSVAATILRDRADDLLASAPIRDMCFKSMSLEKLDELARRLDVSDTNELRTVDPQRDVRTWQTYLGFFGIDVRGPVPFSLAPEREVVRADFGLFSHQRRIVEGVCEAIRGGHGRVVLHMPTGAGKTRTAMHIVCRSLVETERSTVVWLAASGELLDQAVDAFHQAWRRLGNRQIDVLRFWGDYSPDLSDYSDCFIVAGLQKMHALKARDPIGVLRLAKSVGLVVVDEAHQAIAPTYKEVINTLAETGMHNALVGLTATPGRTWSDIDADERLASFFGERKVMLEVEGWNDPVSYLMDEGYLARPTFRRLEVEATSALRKRFATSIESIDYDSTVLESLAEDVTRNAIIVDEIRHLINDGHRRIIFFAASVRHAEVIAAVLTALEIDGRVVTGKTGTTARSRAIKAFRGTQARPIVLCNFGVLTTGFDAPNTSAALIARPTKSLVLFSQMVGRATRGPKAGGNETCTISTVVDVDLPGFGDVADAFTNWEDVWHEPT